MAARLKTTGGTTFDLPGASLDGENPAHVFYFAGKSGDITQTRAGMIVALRSWEKGGTWRIVLRNINTFDLTTLKQFWQERTFYIQPTSSDAYQFLVAWTGSFNPRAISPSKFEVELTLEEVV